ncbi:hypothetical protein HanXRQr2_Chr14g0656791 [Helianthus annuus]|uniref:Uncharacterized protein n=1 Tax=Helianthus annuus TaxID=4232 RepID=A0A9K3ECX2_HELAN|nr:hypothetical protein HanXRQr2_Chr14g0656791 [Helianthus annuus]
MAPKHCATMYPNALINDTFLAKNSPNVTAGLMCPPANTGGAVNKNKDHATESPCDTKDTNTTTLISVQLRVSLDLVANNCQNGHIKKE